MQNKTDAQNLAVIDRKIGEHGFSPAEYEIVRRVIYATADFEYKSLIRFSQRALQSGAAALAARSTIVVDVPMVQGGITPQIQTTFANPVYCSMEGVKHPQKGKTNTAGSMETLARRYGEGIFVLGESQSSLKTLVKLIEAEEIRPALVIGTPSGFVGADGAKKRLQDTMTSHIRTDGYKGNPVVAVAIVRGLVDLAWQAYGHNSQG